MRKSIIRKIIAIVAVAAVLLTCAFALTASAAVKGNLTFYHGVVPTAKTTNGVTLSTATENNMYFMGYVKYDTGTYAGQTKTYPSPVATNVAGAEWPIYVGATKGSSLFDYYVDSAKRHTSTAWWNFDFR